MITFKEVNSSYNDKVIFDGRKNVIARLVDYAIDPRKTMGIYTGFRALVSLDPYYVERQFYATQLIYNKTSGDKLIHIVASFSPDMEIDEELAMVSANAVADIIGREHQLVFGVHINGLIPHIHFIINPVSYINGKTYSINTNKVKIYGKAINRALSVIAPDVQIGLAMLAYF
ncbi:MAG: relaxase/mobilization nuclease domain-containing protein [Lachnospirales bacterium]